MLSEVVSFFKRKGFDFQSAFKVVLSFSKIMNVDVNLANSAALIHADTKKRIRSFGLADAFVLALSRKIKAKVLTCDKHFKSFENVLLI